MSDTTRPTLSKAERYGARRPKVPPFARYEGTSAWRKYPVRVRAYAKYRAALRRAEQSAGTPPGHPPAG